VIIVGRVRSFNITGIGGGSSFLTNPSKLKTDTTKPFVRVGRKATVFGSLFLEMRTLLKEMFFFTAITENSHSKKWKGKS
jgi:hypothetical protein